MKETFDKEWCRVVMLVDADNAFNRLNRNVALKNIKQLCPPLYTYLENSYNKPPRLYLKDGSFILSKEGVTHGDNLAMGKYALGIRGLIDSVADATSDEQSVQVWFAYDSACGGSIEGVQKWWYKLKEDGPKYGYFPKNHQKHIL